MKILVVGLGLIGGSICKALKKYTYHNVTGCDINHDIEYAALRDVALDNIFDGNLKGFDLIIISLFPEASEKFFADHAAEIGENTLITDVCGIKGKFSERMKKIANENEHKTIIVFIASLNDFRALTKSPIAILSDTIFAIATGKPAVEIV